MSVRSNPRIEYLAIKIEADGRLPGSRHTRTLSPQDYTCDFDTAEQSAIVKIAAKGSWTTVEPTNLGPEKALWDNLYGKKILDAKKHPEIEFRGTLANGSAVQGVLTVRGKSVSVSGSAKSQAVEQDGVAGTVIEGSIAIQLPDFGIRRFKALLGMLWVEDQAAVLFRIFVPNDS